MAYTNRNSSFRRCDFRHGATVELGEVYKSGINKMSRRGHTGVANVGNLEVVVLDAKIGDPNQFEITGVGSDTQLLRPSRNQRGRRIVLQESI